jgi:hypothetical protein
METFEQEFEICMKGREWSPYHDRIRSYNGSGLELKVKNNK